MADDLEPKVSTQLVAPTATSLSASLPTIGGGFNTSGIASYDPKNPNLLRLESAWSLAREDSPQLLRVGDAVSQAGSFGSAVRFAGLQYGTAFETRSDLFNSDRLALAGVSVLPSAADAMFAPVSNTTKETLKQRGLSVSGKAAVAGENALAFSARDAAGQRATFTRALMAKQTAAEIGCKKYSVGIGRARENYAIESNQYGALYANTNVACGTDNGYTIEAHGEYLAGHAGLAGVGVMRSVGVLGLASVAVAASQASSDSGWLVKAGLQRSNDWLDVSLRARMQSPEFRELGTVRSSDPMVTRMLASVGAKLSDNNSLAIAYANQTTVTAQRADVVAMTQTIQLGKKGSKGKLSIVADRAVNKDTASSLMLSYVRSLRE